MKNKGFTLVEMLGVMTLLAIIFALVYPNAMEMLEKGKKQDYVEYERTIVLATEAYINSRDTLSMPSIGTQVSVTYDELMKNNYLSTNVVNPKTKKSVLKIVSDNPEAMVIVSNVQGEISYTLSEG